MKITKFPQATTNNTFKRPSNTKSLMLTPVILVCVHDLEEGVSVTHDLLYSIFSTYGLIMRILIFERTNTFKAFIEYDNSQSALEARKKLNRIMLFNDKCRISIYPSNLQTIKFQNNFPGGVDYTLLRQSCCFLNHPGNVQLHPQAPTSISPARYFQEYNMRSEMSPNFSNFRRGSSKSSSMEASSSSNPHSCHEDNEENDDDILQMINHHQKETRPNDNEAGEGDSDKEENEVDNFSSMVKNAFSNTSTYDAFNKEPFNFYLSPQRIGKIGHDASCLLQSKQARRLPCFPSSHTEIPISLEHNSFTNNSVMSTFSEPSLSRFYSMEDIPNILDFNDDRVSQPLHIQHRNLALENSLKLQGEHKESYNHTVSDKEKEKVSPLNTDNTQQVTENKENEKKTSPVLHVLGIESKEVTTRMLFNVFSNFGNILKLIFIKTRAVALVEFENASCAADAKECLNNLNFMGKPFRITFSKYQTIQLQPDQQEKYPEQLIIGEASSFRFKEGKNMKVAAPSATLHVSNLTKEICKDKKAIANYFGAYGEVKSIKSIIGENGKNMCLVKMKSMDDSLKVMAHLHDTELGGRKIQISFSRNKI